MDLSFLSTYACPIIVGICLCTGFIIKNLIPSTKLNKFIPLIMGVLGTGLSIWINKANITPEVILTGLFSGLASTGLYEAFCNVIEATKNKNKETV